MKRESGENPEQSRCCELTYSAVHSHFATDNRVRQKVEFKAKIGSVLYTKH